MDSNLSVMDCNQISNSFLQLKVDQIIDQNKIPLILIFKTISWQLLLTYTRYTFGDGKRLESSWSKKLKTYIEYYFLHYLRRFLLCPFIKFILF